MELLWDFCKSSILDCRRQRGNNMTTVYFVRHAQTDYSNPIDAERVLTEEGLQTRYRARDFLLEKHLPRERVHIYSSNFRRAVDTVRPYADALDLPVIECDAFREWSVIAPAEEYYHACELAWENFDYRYGSCETLHEVQTRNIEKLMELLKQHDGDTIVIGSHGTALSTVIRYFHPAYDYEDVKRIMDIKPWIVQFEFEGLNFVRYEVR